ILKSSAFETQNKIMPVLDPEKLNEMTKLIDKIYVDDKLKEYIVDIVSATREPEKFGMDISKYIEFGASPRATIFIAKVARLKAFLEGRAYVTPQDIKIIAPDVLRHRIILSFEAEAEDITSDEIIKIVFDSVEVP
ncbi:MAG: MoxR family ATPase, partial [Desulfobacteraceae bacterium]|nr:MoxR family ATPase [Desulfobacteraceae bacterium]